MAQTSAEFNQALQSFLAGCQNMIDKYFAEKFPSLKVPLLVLEEGTRYIRIIRQEENQRSCFAFIDSLNGDILKAASWKAPAKHARGNIFDPNPLNKMTAYGPEYIK